MPTPKAKKYREEAEKVRQEAAKTADAGAREALLDIAKQYERLAQWAGRPTQRTDS